MKTERSAGQGQEWELFFIGQTVGILEWDRFYRVMCERLNYPWLYLAFVAIPEPPTKLANAGLFSEDYREETLPMWTEVVKKGWGEAIQMHNSKRRMLKIIICRQLTEMLKGQLHQDHGHLLHCILVSNDEVGLKPYSANQDIDQIQPSTLSEQTDRVVESCLRFIEKKFDLQLCQDLELEETMTVEDVRSFDSEKDKGVDEQKHAADSSVANQPSETELIEQIKGKIKLLSQEGKKQVRSFTDRDPISNTAEAASVTPVEPPQWKQRELQEGDMESRHLVSDTGSSWEILAASRIGKLHIQHDGVREDAFEVAIIEDWNLIAVGDGGGSYQFAQEGSNLATKSAVKAMADYCRERARDFINDENGIKAMLKAAIRQAWVTIEEKADRLSTKEKKVTRKDFSTTLLLVVYNPKSEFLGIAQIGDGLIAAELADGTIAPLGQPESGEYAAETAFLSREDLASLQAKSQVLRPPTNLRSIFVMSDGVSDDFFPPEKRLPPLVDRIYVCFSGDDPAMQLLGLLDYPRRGSFDDRTLVVLTDKAKHDSVEKIQERIQSRFVNKQEPKQSETEETTSTNASEQPDIVSNEVLIAISVSSVESSDV